MRNAVAMGGLGVLAGILAGCSGDGMSANQRIQVVVSGEGGGDGYVYANDAAVEIECEITNGNGGDTGCSASFPDAGNGGTFSLIAIASEGSTFGGWTWSNAETGCTEVLDTECRFSFHVSDGDIRYSVGAIFVPQVEFGDNVLVNSGFETPVLVGTLPTSVGAWRGDSSYSVTNDQGLAVRSGTHMLRFMRGGLLAGAGTVSSQQWQLVNVAHLAAEIDSGKVRLDGSGWFRRVAGDSETDTRFDIRILTFAGAPAGFPTDYPNPVSIGADSIFVGAETWEQLTVSRILPAGTRYVAFEIYAFENIHDDAADPEFDGHYADDMRLVPVRLP